jgi:prophage regulatory protein
MQKPPTPPTRILRKPAVVARVGLSGNTIIRLVQAKQFPPPFRLSAHAIGWKEIDVEAWIASREVRQS